MGDLVLLDTRNLPRNTASAVYSNKLKHRFIGPFAVLPRSNRRPSLNHRKVPEELVAVSHRSPDRLLSPFFNLIDHAHDMSTRPTAAEIIRMQAFLTELLDREVLGTPMPDVRSIQEQFWIDMSAHMRVNPIYSGLQHLDQLARDTMDATPGTTLPLALPSVVVPIPAAEASQGKAPARSKRKSVAARSTQAQAQGHESRFAEAHRPVF